MKIALIQPDSPFLTYPLAFPSLGLLYISKYLKDNGYDLDFYDLTGGVEIPAIEADIIAFSCQITQYREVLKLKEKLKAKVFVIGGSFATFSPDECLKEGFTVVKGEGEICMLNLVRDFPNVKKVYENCGVIDPNFITPDWDAIDLTRYGYGLEGKRCINLMTKRGTCPYNCTFCAKGEKKPLRFRTAKNVLDECRELKDKGFGAIAIYDDDVLIDKNRDYEIFKGLKALGMPYRCMTRTNLATRADLQMLKDTGCAELAIGVESADPYIHEVVCRKGTTVEQDTLFVQTCKEIGLRVKTYLIIGLPSESRESVKATADWLDKVKPDNYDVSVFTPYPGSYIFNHPEEFDIHWGDELKEIWYSGEAQYENCAVYTSQLTSAEILELKAELAKKRGKAGSTDYWKPL